MYGSHQVYPALTETVEGLVPTPVLAHELEIEVGITLHQTQEFVTITYTFAPRLHLMVPRQAEHSHTHRANRIGSRCPNKRCCQQDEAQHE